MSPALGSSIAIFHWGEPERAPHLWIKRKFVYFTYIYLYMVRAYSVYAFCLICADAIFPLARRNTWLSVLVISLLKFGHTYFIIGTKTKL